MSPDPKPIRAVNSTDGNPGAVAASAALLPLASLAEVHQPLVLGRDVELAALCLELPPLGLAQREGQGAVAPPHPVIDGPGLASFAGELGSIVDPNLPPSAATTTLPRAPAEYRADAPALVPGLDPGDRRILASLAQGEGQGEPWPDLAGDSLPGAPWPNVIETSTPWNGPSLPSSAGPYSDRAEAALQAPTGPALDDLLAHLGAEGLALAEPASLFPVPGDPAGDPVRLSGDGPIRDPASRPDSGWSVDEITGSARDAFSGPDRQPATRSGGSPSGYEADPERFSGEMMGELTSRLLIAAERLEQAAERMTHPDPASLALSPRPFHGRVDG